MSPSPTRAEPQRWTMARAASATAAATATAASRQMRPRSPSGIASSMIARKTRGGTRATSADARIAPRKTAIVAR